MSDLRGEEILRERTQTRVAMSTMRGLYRQVLVGNGLDALGPGASEGFGD